MNADLAAAEQAGTELDDAGIEDTSLFLTGRCSCRVKNENPGWDLLLKTDWETSLAEADVAGKVSETEVETAPAVEPLVDTVVIAPEEVAPATKRPGVSWITLGGIGLAVILAFAALQLWRVR